MLQVCAHYYCRHRIRLHYPFHPCVVESFPPGGEDRYFPMELLELIDDAKPWLGNMFKEISMKDDDASTSSDTLVAESKVKMEDDDEEDTGRGECSQDKMDTFFW